MREDGKVNGSDPVRSAYAGTRCVSVGAPLVFDLLLSTIQFIPVEVNYLKPTGKCIEQAVVQTWLSHDCRWGIIPPLEFGLKLHLNASSHQALISHPVEFRLSSLLKGSTAGYFCKPLYFINPLVLSILLL